MRRKKRFTILQIAFALAAVAILPVTAQAKPTPAGGQDRLGMSQIPYLSQGVGVNAADFGVAVGPDNRRPARATDALAQTRVEIPYLSQGVGVTSAELGFAVGTSPDDRPYSRATSLETTPVVSDGGTTIDVNPYAVTGFGLALLLVIGGTSLAIRHTRKGKLSPA